MDSLANDEELDLNKLADEAFKVLRFCMFAGTNKEKITAASTILNFTRPKQRAISFESATPVQINFISALDKARQVAFPVTQPAVAKTLPIVIEAQFE